MNRAAGAKSVARATKHTDSQTSSAIDLQIACPSDTGLDRHGHLDQKGMGISTSAGSGATPATRSATICPTTTIEGDAKDSASARSASSSRASMRPKIPWYTCGCKVHYAIYFIPQQCNALHLPECAVLRAEALERAAVTNLQSVTGDAQNSSGFSAR